MTPFELAKQVYHQEPCARSFEQDFCLHLLYGYVFSTPEYFIMGRAVEKDGPTELILDPSHSFQHPDAWWVWLSAGELGCQPSVIPYYLPYVGWERNNVPRFYKTDRLLRRINAAQLKDRRDDEVLQGWRKLQTSTGPTATKSHSIGGHCRTIGPIRPAA